MVHTPKKDAILKELVEGILHQDRIDWRRVDILTHGNLIWLRDCILRVIEEAKEKT